jgi:hypothetical protein
MERNTILSDDAGTSFHGGKKNAANTMNGNILACHQ